MDDVGLSEIWLPILLVSVATFIASAITWTVLPHHKKEFRKAPDEAALRALLLAQGMSGGQWRIPYCDTKEEMKSPEFLSRFDTGPVGILQFERTGGMQFPQRLIKSFLLFAFIAFFTGYVLQEALQAGESFLRVFQVGGSISFGAHALGHVQDTIWFGKSWKRVIMQAIDSLIFSLVTGAIFAWLWPWA
jgi:hypothetical protein